ncbi:MAG: tetratricopeptide repeat protein [Planctomycetota bacterium]
MVESTSKSESEIDTAPVAMMSGAMEVARWRVFLGVTFILVTLGFAYRSVWEAGFIWDDDAYVENNRTLRSPEGLAKIWTDPKATPQYYPLVHSSYWIEYRFAEQNPRTYHLTNVILHALSAMCLWGLLARLRLPGAFWAALLFALHPVQVESVAWITERKNVLSGLFYFLTFHAWLSFRSPPDRRRYWPAYALTLLLFAAAILSKTVTCTWPCVAALVIWWKSGRLRWRDLLELAPFLWLGVMQGLLTAKLETTHVLAVGEAWDISFGERILIAGRAIWFYLGKVVWPYPLAFSYERWSLSTGAWMQWLAPIAVLVASLRLFICRHRWGRGPLVAWLIFIGTLFPALGFVNVYPMRFSFVADHFQYLAIAAAIAFLVGGGARVAARRGRVGRALFFVLCLLLAALAAWRTAEQTRIYDSRETLWRDTIDKTPDSGLAHNNLGILLFGRGEFSEALTHFRAALVSNQNEPELRAQAATALSRLGRHDEATAELEKALELQPDNAFVEDAYASLLITQGRHLQALRKAERAYVLDARFASALTTKGVALHNLGRSAEALEAFDAAIAQDPMLVSAWNGRGLIMMVLNDTDAAVEAFAKAQALAPHNREIGLNLVQVLGRSGRASEGLQLLRYLRNAGLRGLETDLVEAGLLLKCGRSEDAWRQYQLIARAPAHHAIRRAARRGSVRCLAAAGRHDDAKKLARKELESTRSDPAAWRLLAGLSLATGGKEAVAEIWREARLWAQRAGREDLVHLFDAEAAK